MIDREAMKQALEALTIYSDAQCSLKGRNAITALRTALEQQAEPVASPYNSNPVEYQYHYPDGSWRCSNGEVINGLQPDRARSLYALKDNT